MSAQGSPPTGQHATRAPWRGALVVVTWIAWPLMFYTGEVVVRMSLIDPKGCSVEGCSELQGWKLVLTAAVMLIVPVAVTRWWWRWRRLGHGEAES